jgi:hypothetical protein
MRRWIAAQRFSSCCVVPTSAIRDNRCVPQTHAQLTDQRVLEALKSARFRRSRLQRRYEHDTRRDTDAAGTKIDRHHRSEHA